MQTNPDRAAGLIRRAEDEARQKIPSRVRTVLIGIIAETLPKTRRPSYNSNPQETAAMRRRVLDARARGLKIREIADIEGISTAYVSAFLSGIRGVAAGAKKEKRPRWVWTEDLVTILRGCSTAGMTLLETNRALLVATGKDFSLAAIECQMRKRDLRYRGLPHGPKARGSFKHGGAVAESSDVSG
jgi:transposase